jgi:hypothetical protein
METAKSEAVGPKAPEKGKEPDNRNEEERAFLKWVDQKCPERFYPLGRNSSIPISQVRPLRWVGSRLTPAPPRPRRS